MQKKNINSTIEQSRNTPKLRFNEFSGEWEKKELGEVFYNSKEKGNASLPIYSVTQKYGLIPRDSVERNIQNDAAPGDNLVVNEDYLTYNMMRMWQGALGIAKVKCMVSPAYVVLKPSKITNSSFFMYYFEKSRSLFLFKSYSHGLTLDRLRLYYDDFASITFFIPSLHEQQKIASFLTDVDEKLQALKKKKTLLEQYKKGVMQKIFSQELRFKDDDGSDFPEWEVKKLGDCLDYIQPTKYLVESTEYDNSYSTPVLTAGKTFILGYTNETKGIFEDDLPVIIFDDFTTATQFVDFPFKAKSSAMKILVAKEDVHIKFIYETMNIMNYEIGGHERHWISKFALLDILVPSIEEQSKIANFLSAIDQKIQLVQSQVEKMEVWKKGLLQKMFV
ncbi:MAG: restriction endonuclease subunit S [Saprospiraceae bacterium]|nr:restriction endonuclease subunit S [Saprospiraceae bacterium]